MNSCIVCQACRQSARRQSVRHQSSYSGSSSSASTSTATTSRPDLNSLRRPPPPNFRSQHDRYVPRQAPRPDWQPRDAGQASAAGSSSWINRIKSNQNYGQPRAPQVIQRPQQMQQPRQSPPVAADRSADAEPAKRRNVNYGSGSAIAALAAQRRAAAAAEAAKKGHATEVRNYPQGNSSISHQRPPLPRQMLPARRLNKRIQGKTRRPQRKVEIASITSLATLARVLGLKQARLQMLMERMGMTDLRPDRLLNIEDAGLVATELGYEVVVDDEAAFDIYPSPPAQDTSKVPLRPPIVTIMGHVDHGKTSLLDALRSTKVAAGEAGGITQHIGAFNVPLALLRGEKVVAQGDSEATVTFLDTPGHAAFTAMRSRGAAVTDIVVLVVAADDGVKPQTEEVIKLIKNEDVGLVVAITKCDKPQVDIARVHNELFARGIEVEQLGGDVPCVAVSAHTKDGLDDLVETISTVAEIRDLRAEQEGVACEARVIESQKELGRGNVATVVVTRGTLKVGACIIAGTTFGKVRQLFVENGATASTALPGMPVQVTGWRDLPEAGEEVLEATSEEDAKKAIDNRKRKAESQKDLGDLEIINERRRLESETAIAVKQQKEAQRGNSSDKAAPIASAYETSDSGRKELRLIVKADFNGTVEAVSAALAEIGNYEAGVKIIHAAAGEFTDGDLSLAKAVDGVMIGFNLKASRNMQASATAAGVTILVNDVIYRLIDQVKERVIELLPKQYDYRVLGEASILQIFEIRPKGAAPKKVAGCRITNGIVQKSAKVRIMRDREIIFTGEIDTLKHLKDEVTEVRKGSECGLTPAGFEGFQEGDTIQCFEENLRVRTL